MTIFDPVNVRELATPNDPSAGNVGIIKVFVNGELALDNDKCVNLNAGMVI